MEEFFKSYQHTVSALGAISTLLAVIISLYFGYRAIKANDTIIKALLYESCVYAEGKEERYISISITNKGLYPVRIPEFFLSIISSFVKDPDIITTKAPLDAYNTDAFILQKKYPFKIEPKHQEVFTLYKKKDFIEKAIPSILNKNKSNAKFNIMAKIPLSFFYYFIIIKIRTDDGKSFKVKVSDGLSKELKKYLTQDNKDAK